VRFIFEMMRGGVGSMMVVWAASALMGHECLGVKHHGSQDGVPGG